MDCDSNGSCQIITCDPEHIKTILSTQFDDFEKGPEIRHLMYPLLGTGVFAMVTSFLQQGPNQPL